MTDRIELGPLPKAPAEQSADRFFYLLEVFARIDAGATGRYLADLLTADPRILTIIRQYVQDDVSGLIAGLVDRIDDHLPGGYSFEADPTGVRDSRYAIRPGPDVLGDTDELVGVLAFAGGTGRTLRVEILVDAVNRAFVVGEGETDLSAVGEAVRSLLGFGFLGTLKLLNEPHGVPVFTANLGLLLDGEPGITAWDGAGVAVGAPRG